MSTLSERGGSRLLHRASGRIAATTALVLFGALALPGSTLADAIWSGDPSTSVAPDGSNGPGATIAIVGALFALAVGIVILIALGRGLARIGGRTPVSDELERDTPATASWPLSTVVAGGFLASAAIGGFLAGRSTAAASIEGGLSGIFATVYLVVIGGGVVIALAIVGVAALAFRRGRLSRPIVTVFAAAALVVGGAFAGEVTAGAMGGYADQPAVLRAGARVHLDLDGPSLSFAARDDGQAECRSGPDSLSVGDLSGLDLGELGPGTLRVGLTFGAGDAAPAALELFIDGGDLPDGSPMISWAGPATATATGPGFSEGRLVFTALPLSSSDGKPAEDSVPPSPGSAWPATLSGTLTWRCAAWGNVALDDVTAPPPSSTAVEPSAPASSGGASVGTWGPVPVQPSIEGVVFQDIIWTGQRFVATGITASGGGVFIDSDDGLLWHGQPPQGSASPARLAAGASGVVAVGTINGRLASWASPDGRTWTSRADAFPTQPAGSDLFSVTDVTATASGWLAVGREDPACNTNCGLAPVRALAWSSTDGLHWSRVTDQPSMSNAAMLAISVVGTGFVAVGIAGTEAASWTSPDGLVWTRAADAPAFHELPAADPSLWTSMSDVAFGHGVVVAVGLEGPGGGHGPAGRAWQSVSGEDWATASGAGFTSGGAIDVRLERVTSTPSGFLAVGFSTGSCTGGIWDSVDGASWQCAVADPGFAGFVPDAVASSATVEVVAGHSSEAGPSGQGLTGIVWRAVVP